MDLRDELVGRVRELKWVPAHMLARYENWVNGLNGDWCISRQRFFGVPFPVWYRVNADGTTDYDSRLVADVARLPVDPSTDVPLGSPRLMWSAGKTGDVPEKMVKERDKRWAIDTDLLKKERDKYLQ